MLKSNSSFKNIKITKNKEKLLSDFYKVRQQTIKLIDGLTEEDMCAQSMDDASPTKCHLAHTTWFFETFVLIPNEQKYQIFSKAYKELFNSYYKLVGSQHPRPLRGILTRPTIHDILSYRSYVNDAVEKLILNSKKDLDAYDVIELGINHEQQHQELILTDLLHLFSLNPLKPSWKELKPYPNYKQSSMDFMNIQGDIYEIGHSGKEFCFDHEKPRHKTIIRPFSIGKRLVTNEEWMEFIEDSGYERVEFWLSDGWEIKNNEKWCSPGYWLKIGGEWFSMTLGGVQKINLASPVCHISYYEADAYARWKGKRLPTEAEWEIAAKNSTNDNNTLGNECFRPLPAKTSKKSNVILQTLGDVWEYTQSPFSPYPGFKATSGAIGEYNGKFMNNQMVLRGGSCITPDNHSRLSYRNFFYPFQRWQFTGLRLADDS